MPLQTLNVEGDYAQEQDLLIEEYEIVASPNDFNIRTIYDFIKSGTVKIPGFQRNFTWDIKRSSKLIESILMGLPIPQLFLYEQSRNEFLVIDGQQRLTTIIILLEVIFERFDGQERINYEEKRDLIKRFLYQQAGEYKSYIFGYEKDNPSDEYFKTKVLNQHSLSADKVPEQTLYTANLEFAKEFFKEKTETLSKKELEALFKKIVTGLKFNFYEIDEDKVVSRKLDDGKIHKFIPEEEIDNSLPSINDIRELYNKFGIKLPSETYYVSKHITSKEIDNNLVHIKDNEYYFTTESYHTIRFH